MSRLFLSHSSSNTAQAVAICDWLAKNGWKDVFFDLDAERGIKASERWERALHEAASRCQAVLFLISRAWLDSRWCLKEFNLALRLNKRLFGAVIEDIPINELPKDLTGAWQVVQLAAGQDHDLFRVTLPNTHEEVHVSFSKEGLARLKYGLAKAGLDPQFFAWPPEGDPERPPYRGLKPLEAEDAGIFFGRDAAIIEALDALRGMRAKVAPRLLVILGASGAGKSSFLRAGLLPRLGRDDRNFLPLPVIRPERAAINGETGLVHAVQAALSTQGLPSRRADIRAAVGSGADGLRVLLQQLVDKASAALLADETGAQVPLVVMPIDQAEELFLGEGAEESEAMLELVRDLVKEDRPGVIVLFTIRSDSYEWLEMAKPLDELRQETLPLLPMPRGAYQLVIEGPLARLDQEKRKLTIEPRLTQRLLRDIETGSGSDALPLLAFTLEQLYADYGDAGVLRLADYESFGGITGAIEATVARALAAADNDVNIPRDRDTRLKLLRRGLIPLLAGIDPETGSPRRRVARLADVPKESEPLIRLLVNQRLLATDRITWQQGGDSRTEITIEPAHEALMRQWGVLRGWLEEDRAALIRLEGVKRAAKDWAADGYRKDWLNHAGRRLADAEKVALRDDLASDLSGDARNYLRQCRRQERVRHTRSATAAAAIVVAAALTYGGIADHGVAVPAAASVRLLLDRYGVSVFRPVHNETAIVNAAVAARDYIVARIHHEWIQKAWYHTSETGVSSRATLGVWLSSQAMTGVFRVIGPQSANLNDYLDALNAPFAPSSLIELDGKKFGWLRDYSDYPVSQPVHWTIAALAVALGRGDLVGNELRDRLTANLNYAQTVAALYRPIDDGGWNVVPQQDKPEHHSTYIATLALLAMLELRHAGLGWRNDRLQLDAMLRATAAWLTGQFEEQAILPGWRVHLNDGSSVASGPVSDGLTLQIYGELLRAEEEANIAIPAQILVAIPRHLDLLLGRPNDYPVSSGTIWRDFTNVDGRRVSKQITENYLWYPWAIECTVRWLRRLMRVGSTPEVKVQARRILGYLLVDLGAQKLGTTALYRNATFENSELLYALGTVLSPLTMTEPQK